MANPVIDWNNTPCSAFEGSHCIATGELYPCEAGERLCDVVKTGDIGTLDLEVATLTVGDRTWTLKPLGEVIPVVDAGGVFNYARQTGMLPAQA